MEGFASVDHCAAEVVGHAGQPLQLALRKGLATCRSRKRMDRIDRRLWGHVSLFWPAQQSRISDVGCVKPEIRFGA